MNWALIALMLTCLVVIVIAWRQHAIGGVLRLMPGAAVLGIVVTQSLDMPGAGKYIIATAGAILAGTVWGISFRLPWRRTLIFAAGAIPFAIGMALAQTLPLPLGGIVAGIGSIPFGISVVMALKQGGKPGG